MTGQPETTAQTGPFAVEGRRLMKAYGLSGRAAKTALAAADPAAAGRHRDRAEAMYREMNVPSGVQASV